MTTAATKSASSNQQSAIRRMPAVRVGDLIQYRYRWSVGEGHSALTTRTVIEVIDGGAEFVVEGFYNVRPKQITVHIPMHGESGDGQDEQD